MDNINHAHQNNEIFQKGLSALRKKNYDYAIEFFTTATSDNPDCTECLHYLWSALKEKRKESAPSALDIILEKTQTFFLNIKVFYFQATGSLNKAIRVIKKIIRLNPNNISALFKLATFFADSGLINNSMSTLEEIILIDRKETSALKILSRLYFDNKEFKKAKSTAAMLLEISPQDMEAENILKNIAALGIIEEGFGPNNIKPAK